MQGKVGMQGVSRVRRAVERAGQGRAGRCGVVCCDSKVEVRPKGAEVGQKGVGRGKEGK